jgi:hypothetical protein
MLAFKGFFYEFHKERIVSRPGQPLQMLQGIEVGPMIPREEAFRQARAGKDVCTPARDDAYNLALKLDPATPAHEPPHNPRMPSPTGRLDVYYPHFHPGGDHLNYGHIFCGERGEDYRPTKI